MVMKFLANSDVSVLEWPPQSPELNPRENIWNIIPKRCERKQSRVEFKYLIFGEFQCNKISLPLKMWNVLL
jgi:hypothetical protein